MPAPEMRDRLYQTLIFMVLALFASLVGFFVVTKYYGKLPYANRFVLAGASGGGQTAVAPADELDHLSGDEAVGGGAVQVGMEGRVASTGLRPSGRATIQGETIDVVSVGPFIDPGRKVRVCEVRGNRIVVEEA